MNASSGSGLWPRRIVRCSTGLLGGRGDGRRPADPSVSPARPGEPGSRPPAPEGKTADGEDRREAGGRADEAELPPASSERVAETRVQRAERARIVDLEGSSAG